MDTSNAHDGFTPSGQATADKATIIKSAIQAAMDDTSGTTRSWDSCVVLLERELAPPGHPDRIEDLNNLGAAHFARSSLGECGSTLHDIDAAVRYFRMLLGELSPSLDRSAYVFNLANVFRTRYLLTGDTVDLTDAISLLSPFGSDIPLDQSMRVPLPEIWYLIATLLFNRYRALADREDALAAIHHYSTTLQYYPIGHPATCRATKGLADTHYFLAENTRDATLLAKATEYYTKAMNLTPLDPEQMFQVLGNLLAARSRLAEWSKDITAFDTNIANIMRIRDLVPPEDQFWGILTSHLATSYVHRFDLLGDANDLTVAIVYFEECLERIEDGSAKADILANFTTAIQTRGDALADINDLELSITKVTSALTQLSTSHPAGARLHNILGAALIARFSLIGVPDDLNNAITHFSDASKMYALGNVNGRAEAIMNLASAYMTRFDEFRDEMDSELAMRHYLQLLNLHNNRGDTIPSGLLVNIGNVLHKQFEITQRVDYLESSIQKHQLAVDQMKDSDPNLSSCLNILAANLGLLFDLRGDETNLERALELHGRALGLWPAGHPLHTWTKIDHCKTRLVLLQKTSGLPEGDSVSLELDKIMEDLEAAANDSAATLSHRMNASHVWYMAASQHSHPSGIRAYQTSLDFMQTAVTVQRTLESQHQKLAAQSQDGTLATQAAAYAIKQGNVAQVVEFLEQGNAILLSQLSHYNAPLDKLAEVDGDIAQRFKQVAWHLHQGLINNQSLFPTHGDVKEEDKVKRFQGDLNEWNLVIDTIRDLPGFSDFLKPHTLATLQKAALKGPVVLFLAQATCGHAIIVQVEQHPILVDLPNASSTALAQIKNELVELLNNWSLTNSQRSILIAGTSSAPGILTKLWHDVVEPVILKLEDSSFRPHPSAKRRIWWCPTSSLWSLPLHAAGVYTPGGRKLVDEYISSYTPSLSALLSAIESQSKPLNDPPNPLIVSQPEASGYDYLYGVQDEIEEITSIFPNASILVGDESTPNTVLKGLTSHSWVHFACHGEQDLQSPLKSRFLINGELKVTDILKQHTPHAQLAFLAACHSAAGDERTPNEVLHLTGAMQFAGFQSVVGTLWQSSDEDAAIVAKAFYGYLARNGVEKATHLDSAHALSEAVKVLRKSKVPVDRWINFVHYGI